MQQQRIEVHMHGPGSGHGGRHRPTVGPWPFSSHFLQHGLGEDGQASVVQLCVLTVIHPLRQLEPVPLVCSQHDGVSTTGSAPGAGRGREQGRPHQVGIGRGCPLKSCFLHIHCPFPEQFIMLVPVCGGGWVGGWLWNVGVGVWGRV